MPFPQRKSPRLPNYDYSQSGVYFVTICTHEKQHYFGHIADTTMHLSDAGQIANNRISLIHDSYDNVTINDYIVMPNHVHMILFLADSHDKKPSLSNIVGGYKSGVSRVIRQQLNFTSTLWQPRFHDHIIRNERDLNRIREYVQQNPARWQADRFNE